MAKSSPVLQALAAWRLAVRVESTAMAGRQLVVAGKPALVPLGVATPSPSAQTAAKETRR
jgi:hypothetical protein